MGRRLGIGHVLATAIIFIGGRGLAQTAEEAPAQGSVALAEIIVTAQKRSENIQTVPIAVTAVSSQTLQQQHIEQPSQLVFVASSLQQQSTEGEVGATDFSIRGVGTAVFGPGIESSVATVLDDVTLARPQMGVIQFFDINNIQVLRGPQGTLFGKNASAGAVSINTNMPVLGRLEAEANSSFATHDTAGGSLLYNGNATLNLPIGESSAIRVSGFDISDSPYIRDIYADVGYLGLEEYGGRFKYLWQPNSNLQVYVAGDYVGESGVGDGAFTARQSAPGGLLDSLNGAAGIIVAPNNLRIASNAATDAHFHSGGAETNVKYSFDSGLSITDIAAYREYEDAGSNDLDLLPQSIADTLFRSRNMHQISDELRLASPATGPLTYQVGLYFLNLSYQTNFVQSFDLSPPLPPPPAGLTTIGDVRSEYIGADSYAGFGQGEYHVSDDFKLIFGGRYTHDEIYGRNDYAAPGYIIPLLPPGTTTASLDHNNFSYRVGLDYILRQSLLAYFTYARGYKGPALDETTLNKVAPEIPKSFELGLKSSLLDNRLSINVAAYHTVYHDFQAQALVVTSAADNFLTVNAGSLRVQGLEAEVRAVPARGLTVTGGATFNDGVYTSFTGAPCYPGEPTAASGGFVCLPDGRTNLSGGRLANAPRFTGTLAVQYESRLIQGLNFVSGADLYNRGMLNYTPAPDPNTRVGGITVLGAHLGIASADDRWRLELFARNLTDKRYPTYVAPNPVGPVVGDAKGDYYQTFGPESFRTVGVSVSGRY